MFDDAAFDPKGEEQARRRSGCSGCCACTWRSQCFGLSDERIEAIYDSQVIRRFVGVNLNREAAPDATTLLKLRRLLETQKLTRKVFETINARLARKAC